MAPAARPIWMLRPITFTVRPEAAVAGTKMDLVQASVPGAGDE
jgi:hypothetical protein